MPPDFKLLSVKVNRHGTTLTFNLYPPKYLGRCPGVFRYFKRTRTRNKNGFRLLFPRIYRYKDAIDLCNEWMGVRGYDYHVDEYPYIVLPTGYGEAFYTKPYFDNVLVPSNRKYRSGYKPVAHRTCLRKGKRVGTDILPVPKIDPVWLVSDKSGACKNLTIHVVSSGAYGNTTAYNYFEIVKDGETVSRSWVSGGNLSATRLQVHSVCKALQFPKTLGFEPKKRITVVMHDYVAFLVVTNQMPLRAWKHCRVRKQLDAVQRIYQCPVDVALGNPQTTKNFRERVPDLKFNDKSRYYVLGKYDDLEELNTWKHTQRILKSQAYLMN